ncbi:MAG: glycosyltransferase [Candidatus Dojkabacteria bacterium]|nr:glycosyltransferase [Candidatus Dojkabacteria bacterium]
MKVSLVIPTYKKEDIVLDQLERLYGYLSRVNPDFELIFVVDGYVDNTKDILNKYIKENNLPNISVVGYRDNKGKGYAIRYGMKKAHGDIIGFTDADTDIQIRTLGYALREIKKDNVHVVIPSKYHIDSNIAISPKREFLSKGLMLLNRILLRLPSNISDIGCGLKLFKREVIKRILPNLKVDRFAIDSEILNEVCKVGYTVSVIPFFLNKNRSDSTSDNVIDEFRMFKDILRISFYSRNIFINKTYLHKNQPIV